MADDWKELCRYAGEAAVTYGMIHSGDYTISDIKAAMHAAGVPTRMSW